MSFLDNPDDYIPSEEKDMSPNERAYYNGLSQTAADIIYSLSHAYKGLPDNFVDAPYDPEKTEPGNFGVAVQPMQDHYERIRTKVPTFEEREEFGILSIAFLFILVIVGVVVVSIILGLVAH